MTETLIDQSFPSEHFLMTGNHETHLFKFKILGVYKSEERKMVISVHAQTSKKKKSINTS